ncbi:hypothetical protein MKX07_005094 [Trichoderma sp. CBMAI-0711]|nr:hypothetical protein MKX07_005094 [Trichoderma sp. CBMAI-0711]
MEDSFHGFRFKSQTSLLVSGPHEIDEVEIESMQWQDCRQHEPHHHYCDEATQTPNWEHHDQRVDSPPTLAPQTTDEAFGRQSEHPAWNSGDVVDFQVGDDSGKWRRQSMWYEAGLQGHRPSSPAPQPIRVKQEASDESMQMFPETEPFEAEDASYYEVKNSIACQDIKGECGSDVSSITMEDACEADEDTAWEMAIDAEDEDSSDTGDGGVVDFEDDFLSEEPAGDDIMEGMPQRLYWAITEAQGLWE